MTRGRTKVKKNAHHLPLPDPRDLLDWYDQNRRRLPWRARAKRKDRAYRVWLSEIMLQQTTVAAVESYYKNFLRRWPTVESLAAAPRDDILAAWAGLGYYRRARMLHDCAQIIVKDFSGVFPADEAALLRLPGIGRYTAAAIAAIAFEQRANVVDGNVARIMTRLYAINRPIAQSMAHIYELAEKSLPQSRHGDYAQALMDLGATICAPRRADCGQCPWNRSCLAYSKDQALRYPIQPPKTVKPIRRTMIYWLTDRQGRVWVRQRPEKGLLPGMIEFPSAPWRQQTWQDIENHENFAPGRADWRSLPGEICHSFTHFDLYIRVMMGQNAQPQGQGFWTDKTALQRLALPSVMHKIVAFVAKSD